MCSYNHATEVQSTSLLDYGFWILGGGLPILSFALVEQSIRIEPYSNPHVPGHLFSSHFISSSW